jgi:hypothetical protein
MREGNGRLLAFNAMGKEADVPVLPAGVSKRIFSGKDILSSTQKYTDDGYGRPVMLIEAELLEHFGCRWLM